MHLAAESHVDRSIDGPGDFIQTNLVGTYVMLDASRTYWSGLSEEARAAFRFLHVSTDEVYGDLAGCDDLFREDTSYDPSSPYAATKPAGLNKFEDLITFVTDRPGHDERYAIDASKINADLGWTPDENFESGIRKTVMWYLENEEWWQRVVDGSYQLERLGAGD